MKTKFQTLGCLFAALIFSTSVFAGDPTNNGSVNNGSQSAQNTGATAGVTTAIAAGTVLTTNNVAAVNNIDNTQSALSYHHSSGGSGSSGDGAFTGNFFNVGIGFVSGEGSLYSNSGGTSSTGPAFELSYERALGHFGVGLNIAYQSASSSYTDPYTYFNPLTYAESDYTNTYTDKLSLLQFCGRVAYHFSAGDKFDPYVGVAIGYCSISVTESFSTNDPNSPGDGNTQSNSSQSLTGVEFGGFGGARYFFTDHVGAWIEIQYAVASFNVGNVGGASVSVAINPCTVFNLGVSFKL